MSSSVLIPKESTKSGKRGAQAKIGITRTNPVGLVVVGDSLMRLSVLPGYAWSLVRGDEAIADGGSKRRVVALVLVGVGDGEVGDRPVENVVVA